MITETSGAVGIAPWRMPFLVEGFPSIIVAVFAWYHLPDSPETAVYLTQRQRRVARIRLRKEKSPADAAGGPRGLQWREIWATLVDPKSYMSAARGGAEPEEEDLGELSSGVYDGGGS